MQIEVDLWIFELQYIKSKSIDSAISCGFVDCSKYEYQGPKSERNHTLNVVDLWIFNIYSYSSNGSLSFKTLITQFDVALWIFEIQYNMTIKLKETGQTQGICGFFYVGLLCVIALVAQNDVDLWIFEHMKLKVQKMKVTACKTLWICGFSIFTHLRVLLV